MNEDFQTLIILWSIGAFISFLSAILCGSKKTLSVTILLYCFLLILGLPVVIIVTGGFFIFIFPQAVLFMAGLFVVLILSAYLGNIFFKEPPIETGKKVKTHFDSDDYVTLEQFSNLKGIDQNKVVLMIRDGYYCGRLFNNQWHVHKSELS